MAFREFSKKMLQDPENAAATIRSDNPPLKKAILTSTGDTARSNGLLANGILYDAFCHECGFRQPNTTTEENDKRKKIKAERGSGTRPQWVWQNQK